MPELYDPPRAGLSRHASTASTAVTAASNINEEPPVDELKRSIAELDRQTTNIFSNISRIASLRDQLVQSTGPASSHRLAGDTMPHDFDDGATAFSPTMEPGSSGGLDREHTHLIALTTSTGNEILAIGSPLRAAVRRLERLEAMANAGTAAATSVEIDRCREELDVVRVTISQTVEKLATLCASEAANEQEATNRLLVRIRREEPSLNEQQCKRRIEQIKEDVGTKRVGERSPNDVASTYASERPFTELVQLIASLAESAGPLPAPLSKGAEQSDRHGLTRALTARMRGVMQGLWGDTRMSEIAEEDEEAPLTRNAQPMAGHEHAKNGDDAEKGGPLTAMQRAGRDWRSRLARILLLLSVIGVVAGIVVAQVLASKHPDDDDEHAQKPATLARPESTLFKRN